MGDKELQKLMAAPNQRRATAIYRGKFDELDGNLIAQFEWSKQAAILEVRDAVHYVVAAYQNGTGVEPDQSKAFEWMKKAANLLRFESFYYDLALAYRDGVGTARDVDKFWEWMTKAAEASDSEAMFQLADAHLKPEFGRISAERSAEWTSKMAAAGAPGAMIQLARRYRDGDGVEKDLKSLFDWSKKAVDAAADLWSAASKTSADDSEGGWTYEDYPDALAMLAEAHELRGDADEARRKNREAAIAASEAMQLAKTRKDEAGQRLAEIMLKQLPEFKTKRGTIRASHRSPYFKWLLKVDEAVQYIYFSEDGANSIPPSLVQAVFDLAVAYRDGVGTKRNASMSRKYMERAAKAGHGEAAYLHAMARYRANDLLAFNQFIALAVAANNMRALIAQAIAGCGLPANKFSLALDALGALRETVDHIRRTRHTVQPNETIDGIAHYTDGHALSSMLGGASSGAGNLIRLYSIAYVNDPKEGKRLKTFRPKGLDNPLAELFNGASGLHDSISWQGKDFLVFIACFSLECDSLNLWRFYGQNGTGYSVVSPLAAFDADSAQGMLRGAWTKQAKSAPQLTLYKVLYDDKSAKQALEDLANPLSEVTKLLGDLNAESSDKLRGIAAAIVSELLYLYKDQDYADEKEVRAVEARTLGDPDLKQHVTGSETFAKLYIETRALLFQQSGSSIIVGPKVAASAAVMIDIQHRLARQNWTTCEVKQSKVSYR